MAGQRSSSLSEDDRLNLRDIAERAARALKTDGAKSAKQVDTTATDTPCRIPQCSGKIMREVTQVPRETSFKVPMGPAKWPAWDSRIVYFCSRCRTVVHYPEGVRN